MRESITKDDVFSEIILLKAAESRVILLVEGDSDIRVLDPHVDTHSANCIQGHGKETCVGVMALVAEQKVNGVLALLDRDFDDKSSSELSSSDIFLTDAYDLDATIAFTNDCVERVAANFGSPESIRGHIASFGPSVIDVIQNICAPIGIVRHASIVGDLKLKMHGFPIHEVINEQGGGIDVQKLAILAVRRSREATCTPDFLVGAVRNAWDTSLLRYYCCGHDIQRAIAYLVSTVWGGKSAQKDAVGRALRATFSPSDLKCTRFYVDIAGWAEGNGCKVWRN